MKIDFPALILGLILLAYWGRVVRMAHKARKRTGRAANFLPPELVGRALRLIWVPVVIVWVTHPLLTAFARPHRGLMGTLWRVPWVAWLAVIGAAGCLGASLMCWKRMGKSWRMGIDPSERTPLVVEGPYAYVRHPIYALSQVLMVTSVIVIPSPLLIGCAVVHVALLQWEARREEAYLRDAHGDAYTDYCSRVGRFLPWRKRIGRTIEPRPIAPADRAGTRSGAAGSRQAG
jgi:protein-S-isoprenylcysteine O-methyltransferase Ste14